MNTTEVTRLIEQAIADQSKGNSDSAQALFERIVTARPHHNAALYYLGLAAARRHEHARALELLGRAASSNDPNPAPPEYHIAHASALGRAARHA
jgi:tetratricopeptide (TPR) repeat protein